MEFNEELFGTSKEKWRLIKSQKHKTNLWCLEHHKYPLDIFDNELAKLQQEMLV